MGNLNTGEIYEGALRDPGDVPLTKAQADMLDSTEAAVDCDELGYGLLESGGCRQFL